MAFASPVQGVLLAIVFARAAATTRPPQGGLDLSEIEAQMDMAIAARTDTSGAAPGVFLRAGPALMKRSLHRHMASILLGPAVDSIVMLGLGKQGAT